MRIQFFYDVYYELKHMLEEAYILCQHPTRKQSWMDLKYHWKGLCRHMITHPWYCLKRGIRNTILWFPTIWGIDCFDHSYLIDIMDKQLKEMENFWKKEAQSERNNWEKWEMEKGFRCQYRRIYKRIKWTRKLMSMWYDEHYSMLAYDENVKLFPRQPRLLEHDESLTKYDEYGVPVLYTCKPMDEDCANDYRIRSGKAREMDAKCLKLWQRNLGNIQGWWH